MTELEIAVKVLKRTLLGITYYEFTIQILDKSFMQGSNSVTAGGDFGWVG